MNTREQYKLSHLLYCILKARSERLEPPATGALEVIEEEREEDIQYSDGDEEYG